MNTHPACSEPRIRSVIDVFREMMRSRGAGEPDEDVLGDAIAFHGTSKFVIRVKCAMLGWVAAGGCCRGLLPRVAAEGCLADVKAAQSA